MNSDKRWQDTRYIHRTYKNWYELAGGFGLISLFVVMGLVFFAADKFGYTTNIYTELLGIALTVLVLDKRYQYRAEKARREELVLQMSSSNNDIAVEAIKQLRLKGWLMDGSIGKANLIEANWFKANLVKANLRGLFLYHSDLLQAKMRQVNLANAIIVQCYAKEINLVASDLSNSRLLGCNFSDANFSDSNCEGVDFRNTTLENADFRGANLRNANLTNANPQNIEVSPTTVLPDGSSPTEDTNLDKFVFDDHPEYWQPASTTRDNPVTIVEAMKRFGIEPDKEMLETIIRIASENMNLYDT